MIDEVLLDRIDVRPVRGAGARDAVSAQDRLVREVHLRGDVQLGREGEVEDVQAHRDRQAANVYLSDVVAGRRASGHRDAEPEGRILAGDQ